MDERIESFLADVLALEGERPETVRQGVRTALTDCEAIYRAQETNRRMKDKAVQACHSLCRARVAEVVRLQMVWDNLIYLGTEALARLA